MEKRKKFRASRTATRRRRKSASDRLHLNPFNELLRAIFEPLFDAMPESQVVVSPIPGEMFKKMLFLCHPDKHANHAWATEVTTWLLDERKKARHGTA